MVNKLQDACTNSGLSAVIDLPQIAVVGAQSAGKSSVLENFVGRDFLPRGTGICTRRPLILQLVNNRSGEWGEFLHAKGKRFSNFDEIRQEIEAETDRGTGQNKGISNVPINLRVYSPRVLNLTLVDLPGMTKVPVGDQPATIEKDIREMILQFISKENCLILAVSPANTDLANSDALQISKAVDPQGLRTIGVITKLDLMDQGTDARDILENRLLPLRRGYIGIVNRSQQDINGKKDISAAQRSERQFFLTHQGYSHMADRMGTAYLQKKLNEQLTNHIKDRLPQFRDALSKQLATIDKDMSKYKNYKPNDPARATKTMLTLIQQYGEKVDDVIGGGMVEEEKPDELNSGAKIRKIFNERLPLAIVQVERNDKQLRKQIRITIQNILGVSSGLFTPDKAFDKIARQEIEKLRGPSLNIVDLVVTEYMGFLRERTKSMKAYPRLEEEVERIVAMRIRDQEQDCKTHINYLIDTELSYMNTSHEDFLSRPGVGRGVAEATSQSGQTASATVGRGGVTNQVVRKGYLGMNSGGVFKGGNKEIWFVLTTESLSWYKDSDENEKKFMLPLGGLKIRDNTAKSFMSKAFSFSLYHEEGRNLFKDHKSLDLSTNTEDSMESWKASFLVAGVLPMNQEEQAEQQNGTTPENEKKPEFQESIDPNLERQVETIRSHVESYMKIVKKTVKDRVPKMVMLTIVNNMRDYCKTELLAAIYSSGLDHKQLMEESSGEEERRESMFRMHSGLKDALQIISDINVNTIRSDEPTPVDDSWRKGSAISPNPYAQNALPPSQGGQQPGFGGQGMMQQGRGGPPQMPSRPGGGPPGSMRGPMPPRNALPAPNVPRRPGGPSPQMGGPSMPPRPGQGRGPPPLPSRPAGQPINNNNSLL